MVIEVFHSRRTAAIVENPSRAPGSYDLTRQTRDVWLQCVELSGLSLNEYSDLVWLQTLL